MTQLEREATINRTALRALFDQTGMTQNQFALYANVDKSLVSRLLAGKRTNVTLRTLMQLAAALKVAPNDLMLGPYDPQGDRQTLLSLDLTESGEYAERRVLSIPVKDEAEVQAWKAVMRLLETYPDLKRALATIDKDTPGRVVHAVLSHEAQLLTVNEHGKESLG